MPEGKPLGTLVFKPEEIYHKVRNVAPDLIVHFGALYWRSIGGVGYPTIHVLENDTGPDDCNHAQFGSFILAASNSPLHGEVTGAASAGHRADAAGTGGIRDPRLDAGPVARIRWESTDHPASLIMPPMKKPLSVIDSVGWATLDKQRSLSRGRLSQKKNCSGYFFWFCFGIDDDLDERCLSLRESVCVLSPGERRRASEREFRSGFQRCSVAERNKIEGESEMTKP